MAGQVLGIDLHLLGFIVDGQPAARINADAAILIAEQPHANQVVKVGDDGVVFQDRVFELEAAAYANIQTAYRRVVWFKANDAGQAMPGYLHDIDRDRRESFAVRPFPFEAAVRIEIDGAWAGTALVRSESKANDAVGKKPGVPD